MTTAKRSTRASLSTPALLSASERSPSSRASASSPAPPAGLMPAAPPPAPLWAPRPQLTAVPPTLRQTHRPLRRHAQGRRSRRLRRQRSRQARSLRRRLLRRTRGQRLWRPPRLIKAQARCLCLLSLRARYVTCNITLLAYVLCLCYTPHRRDDEHANGMCSAFVRARLLSSLHVRWRRQGRQATDQSMRRRHTLGCSARS